MNRRTKVIFNLIDLVVIFVMTFGSPLSALAASVPSPTGATIASDLADYTPGATVTLTGAGWAPTEAVHIFVNDTYGSSWQYSTDVTASGVGGFTTAFQLPTWFISDYDVIASGPTSGTATTTFTDLSVGTYDQCANDLGIGYPPLPPGTCQWITGNLQQSNSVYAEGDATVQRLWLTSLVPGSTHTVTFDYATTKGGKHAYDFLTTWDWSESWITLADRCTGIAGCTSATETYTDMPDDPNVPNTIEPTAAGARLFTMRGGALSGAAFAAPIPFTGSYTGDSDTRITISFKVDSSGPMCSTKSGVTTCDVALWFGAHVARTDQWSAYNGSTGAGSISGSPYHVMLALFDGASAGSRDNQMASSAVPANGTIVIVKTAVPKSTQSFSFNLSGNNGLVNNSFSLTDSGTPPNSLTFSEPPGTYTVSELNIPTGWNLTGLACTVTGTNGSTFSLASPIATITLKSSDTVTCTYTDTQKGTIIVKKVATGGDATFAYTTNGGDGFPAGFNITTSGGNGSQTYTNITPGTYSVTETPLSGWTLTGSSCDGTGNTPGSFTVPAGGTVTCTFNNTRTYNKDLTVTKTATPSFGRLYKWLIDKKVDKTEIDIAQGGSATFNYTVTATPNGFTDSAWAVAGKITVANSNAFAVSGVTVSDAINNGGACTVTGGTNVTVPANGSVVLDYSCTYAAAPSPAAGTNTATATWDKTTYDTPNASASGTAGVDFSTTTPSETDKTITVVDDKTDPANPVTLGTATWGATATSFNYALTKSGVGGKCTSYTNTAKISETGQTANQTVKVCSGLDLTVSKTAAGNFNRAYQWSISKSVDQTQINVAGTGTATFNYTVGVVQTGISDSGWTLSGKITLSNPNDWEDITLTGLTDAVSNGGICTVDPGPYKVLAGKTLDVNYSCAYTAAPSSYSGTNTATATWDKAAASTPSGEASGGAGFTLSQLGATNKTIHVTDSLGGDFGTVTATDPPADPATATFRYSHSFPGVGGTCKTYDNTATITETKQSASKTVTVCSGLDLTVSKTAAGTFNRTYLWSISKAVDATLVKIADGGSYTFNYTVDVAQTGISDAGWTLSGKITVTNPNNWEDITLTGLSDVVDNGGICTVDPGLYLVPKSGSLEVNYSCTYASAPSSYSGTNTATANWDKAAAFTPTGTASGGASFTLSQLGTTNKTVHVTDSYGGVLGTVTATDGPTFASKSFTYTRTEKGAAGTCTKYDNTATITETGASASKSVTLCVAKDLTVSKIATPSFGRTYTWGISKSVDQTQINIAAGGTATFNYTVSVTHDNGTDSAWAVSGTITVVNPNDFEDITLTSLTDAVNNGGTCTVAAPVAPATTYVIPMGGSLTVNYSCTYASAPTSYSGSNTATASWDKAAAFTPSGTASGNAAFSFVTPAITDGSVSVTDTLGGTLGTVSYTDPSPTTFTYSHTFSGDTAGTCTSHNNTATFTTNTTGTTGSASQSVKVCVGKDLTVSKTAAGTFDRTYKWLISKAVDKTQINIAENGTATFNYTVTVTPNGYVDSGWTLAGQITVTNPNDWEAITADVTDAFPGGTCTVTGGTGVVVPASQSVTRDYSCAFTSQPAYTGTNTATATWNAATYFTTSGTVSGTAGVTLTLKGETHRTITVVDNKTDPINPVTLGTSDYYTGQFEFSYSLTKSGVAGTCTDYTNTATIQGTNLSAGQTVKVCVAKDLTVSKTAAGTFDRTYLWQISKNVDATSVSIAAGGSYTFHYTVDVAQTGISDSGWKLGGTITVFNPNNWEDITLTSLTDGVDTFTACSVDPGPYVVPKGGSLVVNYTCGYQNTGPQSYSGTNTATATWDKTAASTPHDTASGTASFTLTQAGSTNKTINVTDSFGGPLGTVTATDGPTFASQSFPYTRTESGVAGTCKTYDNTATITETNQTASQSATLCVAKDLTVSKTATGTFDRAYLWKISKDVDKTLVNIASGGNYTFHYTVVAEQTGFTDSGWKLSGTITVTNPNDFEDIALTGLSDAVDNGGTCTVAAGTYIVPKSGSLDVNYSCSFTSAPTGYSGTNTATATWDKTAASTPTGSASGNKAFTLTQLGATNKTINVTDSYGGPLGTVTATDGSPFATATFTYTRTESGVAGKCTSYDNTATITETGATAGKTVTLCVAKDLSVSKTAAPAFTRTFQWDISKAVDQTLVRQMSGSVTFNYTVVAKETGFTDSAWKVTGTITVTNPNDWEAISANVSDAVDNGGTCTVTGGTAVSIPASGSKTFDYACTYASKPAYTGINTASATWDKKVASTPNGTASGTANFTFDDGNAGNPTNINQTVTVTDNFNGTTTTLGTLTAGTITPYTTQTFNYAHTVDVPPAGCVSYDNTAKIVETGQTAGQKVTVCKPALITDTMLCTLTNDQFRLIFTPDQQNQGAWKLNASNPGQFYYNLFYTGPGNVNIKVTLPYPWVTQSAVPIHAYSDVGVTTTSSGTCLTPGTLLPNPAQSFVTLASYSPQAFTTPPSTTTITVHVPATSTGFVYLNIHLDYGLKGTTGYAKDTNNNAVLKGTSTIVIPDLQTYTFSDTSAGSAPTTITSTNAFKKDPGIGGLVLNGNGDPIKGANVAIFLGTSKTAMATLTTDEDGWYMWQYKWTGKAASFTVKMTPPAPYAPTTQSATVYLKSNGYLVVNFTVLK